MFRSHLLNRRLFFTQPSLAFFDATKFKPRRTVHLTPANYAAELDKNIKPDWILVPQPRPPSPVYYLIVNKTNNKVMGRLRPPLCVPFPRKHSGFSLPENNENLNSSNNNNNNNQSLTKDHLLNFHSSFQDEAPTTWLLACSDRAIGTCLVDKMGNVRGDMMNFSLLCTQNKQNPGSSMSSTSVLKSGAVGGEKNVASSSGGKTVNLSNEYDSPGFVRPGREAPIWEELFSWIDANLDENLAKCCNWIGRRDDWTNNVMWDDLKAVQRHYVREQRYNNYMDTVGNGASANDDDDNDENGSNKKKSSASGYFEENPAVATGGHEEGSKEASMYRSQLALERRTVMDSPKWLIVPPSMMPRDDYVKRRTPDEINTIGAVGRLRTGFLDFV